MKRNFAEGAGGFCGFRIYKQISLLQSGASLLRSRFALLRQPNALDQINKARIVAQGIHQWIDPQKRNVITALVKAFFQLDKGVIFVPQADIDHGKVVGVHRLGFFEIT